MKILFYATSQHIGTGSYRIWVNDLHSYFHKCGISSTIGGKNFNEVKNYDVIICSKADADAAVKIKNEFPKKKVGVINLRADLKLNIDFVIVGSIEEMNSLSHYKNVFLYPLIEKMYQNEKDYKTHTEKDILRVGFHGHYPHLSKFEPHLKKALEKFNKLCQIQLLVITGNPDFNWQHGKPNIKIINKKWDFKTIKDDIMSCDIGIVPNITCQSNVGDTNENLGLYNTDYILRLKNKSNAGRSFVFHQLGVPVIADLTPSNFHILGNPDNGFIANNKSSWFKGLVSLKTHKMRQQIADNAKAEFDRLYDPKDWARRLYKSIERI